MKYLLTIFIEHKNQELFVNSVASEISSISSKNAVKFFFGPQTAIFTFETKLSFETVKNFFDSILSDLSIVHILTPIKTDKMSYWFEKDHEQHLFGTNICRTNEEFSDEEQEDLREAMFGDLGLPSENYIIDKSFQEMMKKVTQITKEKPTLDDLLDKINMSGFDSLTTEEKDLLKQYSN